MYSCYTIYGNSNFEYMMSNLKYRVIINKENYEDGTKVYTAYCPVLGVYDYGDSIEEVLESIKDGIELAIECLVKEGKDVPIEKLDEQIITSTEVSLEM